MKYRYEHLERCKVCKGDIVHKLSPGEDTPAGVYYCSVACKNKDYRCKVCGKDLWGEPSNDAPVSEYCGLGCQVFYLEAVVIKKLEERLDSHIKGEQDD